MKKLRVVLAFVLGFGTGLVTSGAFADGVTQARVEEDQDGLIEAIRLPACDLPDAGEVFISMGCPDEGAVVLILEPGGALRWEKRLDAGKEER